MKDRRIPDVFWKRGKQIVNNGDVDIEMTEGYSE